MGSEQKTLGEKVLEIPYWYHRIELPGGNVTPGWAPLCADKYGIPDDLAGKRVLDIGAWDGFWTWEALKRGAKEVVAIDDFSDSLGNPNVTRCTKWETFDLCREAFGFVNKTCDKKFDGRTNATGQYCQRAEMSLYDISEEKLGHFDVVFFFGTIYHLKHPLLALEKISAICDGEIYIESAICDDYSPYRGGLNHGYPNRDVIMEFYPYNNYGNNPSNWWVPTLQCLGSMTESAGFKNIQAWALTDTPKGLPECRGFVYGSKTAAENGNVVKLTGACEKIKPLTVAAVMSVPRLGFQDNSFCVHEALTPLRIPLVKTQGAFWGQCLERGMQQQIDLGVDAVMTIDYDSLFTMEDVMALIRLMQTHPEADAIVPLQLGRAGMQCLMTLKTITGQPRELVDRKEFEPEITKIATGHFGLTLLRSSSLMKLPHPWFKGEPNSDGQWGPGRIDDDVYLWKQMGKAGMCVYSANRVVIGHLELIATWPDENLKPIYSVPTDFSEKGKPAGVWK